jgi:Flp pilus assembly protein CpaB
MMVRIGLFLTLALGLVGFAVVAWISIHPHHPNLAVAPPPPPVTVQVLVAATPLRAGSLLRPEDIVARQFYARTCRWGRAWIRPPTAVSSWAR